MQSKGKGVKLGRRGEEGDPDFCNFCIPLETKPGA